MRLPFVGALFAGAMALLGILPAQAQTQQSVFLNPGMLDGWLDTFRTVHDLVNPKSADPKLIDSLAELESWTSSPSNIMVFRNWEKDDEAVILIIPLAANDFRPARIPATTILANVVDNTNVCYVLDYLVTAAEININGRYNLLQVVNQVASYSYNDTALWIEAAVQDQGRLFEGAKDVANTIDLLNSIRLTLNNRGRGAESSLAKQNFDSFDSCLAALVFDPLKNPAQAEQASSSALRVEAVRSALFSDDRHDYDQDFIGIYEAADETGKKNITRTLLDSIIVPDQDPRRASRVNSRIATVFSGLPAGAISTPADYQKLSDLTLTRDYENSTFKADLDNALAKQKL